MDFVKNLGLLICGTISFILACVLLFFMFKTAGRMKTKPKVQEQMSFFERVAQQGYKLTAAQGAELENLVQAQKTMKRLNASIARAAISLAKLFNRAGIAIDQPGCLENDQ